MPKLLARSVTKEIPDLLGKNLNVGVDLWRATCTIQNFVHGSTLRRSIHPYAPPVVQFPQNLTGTDLNAFTLLSTILQEG